MENVNNEAMETMVETTSDGSGLIIFLAGMAIGGLLTEGTRRLIKVIKGRKDKKPVIETKEAEDYVEVEETEDTKKEDKKS